jgi:PST family polysaccharide transporter
VTAKPDVQVDEGPTLAKSPGWLTRLFRQTLFQNIMSLYGLQVFTYIVPLITIPYLARVLGAPGWGRLAFAQAFGGYLVLVMGFGFGLSATREVARYRDDRESLAAILSSVVAAKALLAIVSVGLALFVAGWISGFKHQSVLLWASIFWAVAQSFHPAWFFQGLERMRLVAVLDISAKGLATIGIFMLVRSADAGWKVLVLQGFFSLCSAAIAFALIYRNLPLRLPTRLAIWNTLRQGSSIFLLQGAVSFYTLGNAFILGLFAPSQFVGYYAGAEKISRASLSLLGPIGQAFYPRISHIAHRSRTEAAALARIGLFLSGIGGILLSLLVFVGAAPLVHLVLGPGFDATIPVLRILSLLPALVALNQVLGLQWMLPLGLDRSLSTIVVGAGILNVLLAVLLASRYGQIGMAWSVVTAETFVAVSIYCVLRARHLHPLTRVARTENVL